jgi:hypothetical protein
MTTPKEQYGGCEVTFKMADLFSSFAEYTVCGSSIDFK